jgi:hypothetical protein
MRNARTVKVPAVAETNSRNDLPGGTPARSAKPSSWYR